MTERTPAQPTSTPSTVLYIDNSYTFGGAINSLLHLLRGLDPERVRPVLVSGQDRSHMAAEMPELAYHEFRPALPWVDNRTFKWLLSLRIFRLSPLRRALTVSRTLYWLTFVTLADAYRYYRIGRAHRVDVVHLNNNIETQLPGIVAARWLGVPCVVHSRCFQVANWSLLWSDRLIDHHVAISTAVRDNLVEMGIAPEKVSTVYDAIDLDEFDDGIDVGAVRAELGIGEGERSFGLFGRIVEWKGTLEFVEAAARVLSERSDCKAFIVGDASDGEPGYYEEVVRLIRDRGLEGRVILTGYRKDVAAVMQAMDVVVHASITPEPFGMVLIEGMAMRKPIVATEGGGPEDVVVPGETGLLVPRRDPAALADAVLRILADPPLAKRMGELGRARVLAHFSKERYADEIEAIYARVLSRAPRPSAPSIANVPA